MLSLGMDWHHSTALLFCEVYASAVLWPVFLQLRWAKEAVRRAVSNGGRNCSATALHGLGMKLHHMVDSLEHYVMFTLGTGWTELEKVKSMSSHADRKTAAIQKSESELA